VFIYHLEGSTRFARPAGLVLEQLALGSFTGVTSMLTLMELTVKPLQMGRPDIAEEYEILLANYPHLLIPDVNRQVVRQAAALRARHRLSPANAIQVGTAMAHSASAFVTNDRDLRRVNELQVLLLADFI